MATPVAVGHTLTPQEAQAMGWSSGSYSPAPQQPPAQAPTNTPPQYTPPPAGTPSNVPTYGSTFYSPQTGQAQGTNQFDPNTGEPLNQPTQPSESTTPPSPEEDTINANQAMMDKWTADLDARSNQFQETMNQYINGSVPLSSGERAQVDGLTQQYKALIDQQKLTNTGASGVANIRGYQTGAAEYDPMFQAKTIGSIVTAGINKVADLNTKMASSVAVLTEQFKKDDMAAIKSAWDEYQDYAEKRTAEIQKTIDKAQAKIKAYQDHQDKVTDDINKIAMEAAKNGADADTINKIVSAGSIAQALTLAGDSLQSGSGIVGEYMFYKKQALAANQVPVDFNTYQNMDANRKIRVAAAGVANQYGLDKEQRSRVYSLMDDYDKQTKDIKTVISASSQIDALSKLALSNNPDKGSRAASQIGTIFSFMKMLDPASTVREGEYATAQNTAGVSDKVRNAYNKAKDGSFLTDGQINGYVATARALAESRKRNLEDINTEFDRRGELSGIPRGTISNTVSKTGTGSLVQDESDAQNKVINYGKINPTFQPIIFKKINETNPFTGNKYTFLELLQIYPEIQ